MHIKPQNKDFQRSPPNKSLIYQIWDQKTEQSKCVNSIPSHFYIFERTVADCAENFSFLVYFKLVKFRSKRINHHEENDGSVTQHCRTELIFQRKGLFLTLISFLK